MYYVSIYFDEMTTEKMQGYINRAAHRSGNMFMLEEKVPPHLTVSAFEVEDVQAVCREIEKDLPRFRQEVVQWVSPGVFLPHTIYVAPVLSKYLLGLSLAIYSCVESAGGRVSRYYQPFCWMPHMTVAKGMSGEELRKAFVVLQEDFQVFSGQTARIGLAKTNPYQDIAVYDLVWQPRQLCACVPKFTGDGKAW